MITLEDMFDVQAEQENGRLQRIRRRVRLAGIASTDPDDYVQEVLGAPVLPASGTFIVVQGQVLFLDDRQVQVGSDVALGEAIVDLVYQRREGSSAETGAVPTLEVRGSLRRVERSVDRAGNPFLIQYSWPEESTAVYANGQPKKLTTERVGGVLSVFEPAVTLVGEVLKATNTPGAIVTGYVGKVNSITWQGFPARHWLCTDCTATLQDDSVSPKLWSFAFSFELDKTGWDTQTAIAFINPDTGQPPEDIAEGNGLLTVDWYETKNFNEDF